MSERLTKCPLCKSGHFLNYTEITDHAVSKENFMLCKCSKCGLVFTNPRPSQEEIGPYYNFPEYYSHSDRAKSLTQLIYQSARGIAVKKKVKLISGYVSQGKILDYGCGTAEFLTAAKKAGWQVTGIEPNKKARNLANTKLGKRVLPSLGELKKKSAFDIITLFHVLEHIHPLRKTVKKLITYLNSDGYILIAVPNHQSYDAKKYGAYWAGWDVPRHLYHFNPTSIGFFQEEFNLQLVDTKPMKMDSFYVSLLSEGYKYPKQTNLLNYWKAFHTGIKSNQMAVSPGNYSSNIYIFKKK